MIARGFRPVAWVAAVGTAALGCYMLSLQVAAERSELASLETQIIRTQQDIRSLQTEIGTRGRLQQLEHWNAEVLALSAPVAGQFLESGLTLARFDVDEQPADAHGKVQLASASVPSSAAPQAQAVSTARPAVARTSNEGPKAAEPSLVRRASLEMVPEARIPAVRPAAVQVRSSLLDESTLRELTAQALAESGSKDDD